MAEPDEPTKKSPLKLISTPSSIPIGQTNEPNAELLLDNLVQAIADQTVREILKREKE